MAQFISSESIAELTGSKEVAFLELTGANVLASANIVVFGAFQRSSFKWRDRATFITSAHIQAIISPQMYFLKSTGKYIYYGCLLAKPQLVYLRRSASRWLGIHMVLCGIIICRLDVRVVLFKAFFNVNSGLMHVCHVSTANFKVNRKFVEQKCQAPPRHYLAWLFSSYYLKVVITIKLIV